MRETFIADFAGSKAAALVQHPMLLHASWMERMTTHVRDINMNFFEPLCMPFLSQVTHK